MAIARATRSGMRRMLAFAPLALVLAGCPTPPSSQERLAQSAYEMSSALRFAHLTEAATAVAPKAQGEFARQHAAWGRTVRIVDYELVGLNAVDRDHAEVLADVSWQRPTDATIRATRVAQRWENDRSGWHVVSETRKDGDVGLLDDAPAAAPASTSTSAIEPAQGTSRFQTRVIRETGVDDED